jgi:DNA-binding transcriptional LysR family regulator
MTQAMTVEHGQNLEAVSLMHLVQAPAVLFLTQPAPTRSIHVLEGELSGALCDHLGRRVASTPSGLEILEHARRLLGDAQPRKKTSQALHVGLTGRLRLGLSSAPGALFSTPPMLQMAE